MDFIYNFDFQALYSVKAMQSDLFIVKLNNCRNVAVSVEYILKLKIEKNLTKKKQ